MLKYQFCITPIKHLDNGGKDIMFTVIGSTEEEIDLQISDILEKSGYNPCFMLKSKEGMSVKEFKEYLFFLGGRFKF